MVKVFIQPSDVNTVSRCYAETIYIIQWNVDITNLYIMKSLI